MKPTRLLTLTTSLLLLAGSAQAQYFGVDFNNPTLKGSVTTNGDNSLSIIGGGSDYWGTSDSGYYYYAWASGQQWSTVVKVTDLQGPDNWTKAELMVRWSNPATGPQATDAFIAAMTTRAGGQNMLSDQFRPARSADCASVELSPVWRPAYPNQWMRLTRTNSIFTVDYGTDGVNWTNYFTVDTSKTDRGFGTAWPDILTVGLAVTAHNNSDLGGATATFANWQMSFPSTIQAPTVIGATAQVQNATNYEGCEVSFKFATTNNAVPNVLLGAPGITYQWYKNGTVIPGATGTRYTALLGPNDNGAQVYCQATVNPPFNSSVSGLRSATGTITMTPGAILYTNGLKVERFYGASRGDVKAGNVDGVTPSMISGFDLTGGFGANYSQRVSGWFIPPTTANYTFYVASDDDCELFLSTDRSAANKRVIAQEMGWSGYRSYVDAGGDNALEDAQKCSDTWQADMNNPVYPAPHANGIALSAGQPYYLEAVMHQGGGGDNLSVTYKLFNEPAVTNGTPSRLHATNNNLVLITSPTTNLVWTSQPTNTTVYDGFNAVFTAKASSDTELAPNYQWYRNNSPIAGATGTSYQINPAVYADNNAQFSVVVSTAQEGLSITSSVVTLTVLQSVVEKGWAKVEHWNGASRAAVKAGTAGDPTLTYAVPAFEVSRDVANSYIRKISAFFIPPQTASYDFFVCSDDGSELYLSTDNTPGTKRLIAQETGWNNAFMWGSVVRNDDGTYSSTLSQKRSDQWVPDPANPPATPPYASGIALTGNQMYYMEVVHEEGSGGDNVEATYKLHTELDPVDGTDTRLKGNVIGLKMNRANYVAFTQHPSNTTAAVNSKVVFTAAGITDSTMPVGSAAGPLPTAPYSYVFYQWYKNGTAIPGATSGSLSIYPVQPSDSGAQFMCQMRALGYVDNAQNPIWSNSASATLTVAGQPVFETGYLQQELWWGKDRATVEAGDAGAPNEVAAVPVCYLPNSVGDNFARRFAGYFIPPTTDDYVFFVNADDDADLFLSKDASSMNRRLIAQQVGWGSAVLNWGGVGGGGDKAAQKRSDQFTSPTDGTQPYALGIRLTGGQKYYLEAVHHEGGNGDWVAATFTNVANIWGIMEGTPSMFQGNSIGFYVPRCSYVAFTQQPQNVSAGDYSSATFRVAGSSDAAMSIADGNGRPTGNYLFYQWYRNGSPIAGANRATYTIEEVTAGDNGAQFMCAIRALGYASDALQPIWSNSQPATLTVGSTPPAYVSSAIYTDYNPTNWNYPAALCVDVSFNKRMDATTLSNKANYVLTGGLVVTNVAVSGNGRTVKLYVSGTPSGAVSVSLNGLKDASGLSLGAVNAASVRPVTLVSQDIGSPAYDPIFPSLLWVENTNAYTVVAQGSDIWGNADGFNFLWEQKTGDFDVVVRQKKITHTSQWAKGGLMVRETLEPGSRNWNIINTPLASDGIMAPDNSGLGSSAIECNTRNTPGGVSSGWDFARGAQSAYPNAWVRLKRTGDQLSAYYSTNGVTWTLAGTNSPSAVGSMTPLPASVYVGICTTAHNNDTVGLEPYKFWNTSEYDNYNSSYVALPPSATLKVSLSGSTASISWTPAGGRLQSSPALGAGAQWTDVVNATNPMTIQASGAAKFYRVVNP